MPEHDILRFVIVLTATVIVLVIVSKIVDSILDAFEQRRRIKAIVAEMALRDKNNDLFEVVQEAQREFKDNASRGRKVRD